MRRLQRLSALPLLLSVCGCITAQESYEARQRAVDTRMVESAQRFSDKLKADGEAQIADYDRRLQTWKPQLREYSVCNKNASRVVATQPGDPLPLAIAARNLCRAKEAELRKAIYAAYTDNPSFGMEALEKMRKSALENNTGEIVAYRIKASAPSAPARPAEPTAPERRI